MPVGGDEGRAASAGDAAESAGQPERRARHRRWRRRGARSGPSRGRRAGLPRRPRTAARRRAPRRRRGASSGRRRRRGGPARARRGRAASTPREELAEGERLAQRRGASGVAGLAPGPSRRVAVADSKSSSRPARRRPDSFVTRASPRRRAPSTPRRAELQPAAGRSRPRPSGGSGPEARPRRSPSARGRRRRPGRGRGSRRDDGVREAEAATAARTSREARNGGRSTGRW